MGGAMLYYGWPYYAWSAGYDTYTREKEVKKMYQASTVEELKELIEEHNIRYLHHMADGVTMDIMNLCLLLRVFPDHEYAPVWKKGIRTMWDQGKTVLLPDGRYLTLGFYQMDTGKTVEPYEDSPLPWAKSAWSTMVVRGGLMGLKYMPECREEVTAAAQNVIDKLDPEDMTYIEDLRLYPDKWKHKERFLSGDAIANYLWSYELLKTF